LALSLFLVRMYARKERVAIPMTKGVKKAILLVDHGSRLPEANEVLAGVAELLAEQDAGYHVEISHMELAEPTIEQGIEACVAGGAKDITVLPYLLAPGRHATADIPRLVRQAMNKHPGIDCRLAQPLGLHPLLARVILERVREAATREEALIAGKES
jgi:sirohydrochlorin ferrochelatase